MSVGNDYNLVDEAVHDEFRLNLLWSDVFSVGRFIKVFDSVGQEEFSIFNVTGVTGVKPAFVVDDFVCFLGFAVIFFEDGVALEQDFVVLTDFGGDAFQDASYGTDGEGLSDSAARDGGRRLSQSIARYHLDAADVYEGFYLLRDGGAGCGEEVGAFQS